MIKSHAVSELTQILPTLTTTYINPTGIIYRKIHTSVEQGDHNVLMK